MRLKQLASSALLLVLATGAAASISNVAAAQQVKPLDPSAPLTTTPVGKQLPGSTPPAGAAGSAAAAASALSPMPPSPPVNDKMLTPPASATRELASWADAVNLTRARSTDLATAFAEIAQAEAATRIALAQVLPDLNATVQAPQHQFITKKTEVLGTPGDPPRVVTSPQSDYVNASVTLQQQVVNVQNFYAIKTAKENEKVQRFTAEDVARRITLAVATAVVGVVAAERVAELNRIGLRTALERRELTSRKQVLGVGTGLDVVRADQDVSTARAAIVTGDEALRQAREALGLALGLPEQVGVSKDISVDAVAQEAEKTCPRIEKIEQRADILSAQKAVIVAERGITNQELNFLPTITAQSTFATTSADLGNTAYRNSWNISAVLTIPIWDGGQRYGQLRNARALRDEANFTLEATKRTATVALAQAERSVEVAQASLEVARETQQLAARVDQLTQTAYRAGQGTSLELVTAASALRTAEVGLAIQEFNVVTAKLNALFSLAHCAGAT